METTRVVWSWYKSLQLLLHARHIRNESARIAAKGIPSLLSLPDDMLLLILDVICDGSRRDNENLHWHTRPTTYQSFVDLSMTNKHMRALASPKLFRTISMGRSWSPERVYAALASIQNCEAVVKYSQTLKFDLWLGDTPQTKRQKNLALDVVPLILSMSRLQKLVITMQDEGSRHFRTVCEDSDVVFPQIKELVVCPGMMWLT